MKRMLLFATGFIASNCLIAQNVGIGSSNPVESKLVVLTSNNNVITAYNNTALAPGVKTGIYFKTGASFFTGGIATIGSYNNTNGRIGLFTYASPSTQLLKERFTITDSGFIGINDTAPQTIFHLNGYTAYDITKRLAVFDNAKLILNGSSNGTLAVNGEATFSQGPVTINNGSKLGIGVTPAYSLDINTNSGGIRIVDGNQAIGRVLTSDANGITTWKDPLKSKSLSVNLKNNQSLITSTATKPNFGKVGFYINEFGSAFDETNQTFTVPAGEAGVYLIVAQVTWNITNLYSGPKFFNLVISKNDFTMASAANEITYDGIGSHHTVNLSRILPVNAGDVLKCEAIQFTGDSQTLNASAGSTFLSITKLN